LLFVVLNHCLPFFCRVRALLPMASVAGLHCRVSGVGHATKNYLETDSPCIDLLEPASVKSGKSLSACAVRKAGSTI